MKDVRAILMYQNAGIVVVIVSIAADVRPLVAQQDLLIRSTRKSFCDHTAGKTGPHNQIIKHLCFSPLISWSWHSHPGRDLKPHLITRWSYGAPRPRPWPASPASLASDPIRHLSVPTFAARFQPMMSARETRQPAAAIGCRPIAGPGPARRQ